MQAQVGPPGIVEPVIDPRPVLDLCLQRQEAWVVHADPPRRSWETIDIVRETNPQRAYMINRSLDNMILRENVPGWGFICFGIILPRVEEGVYEMPNPMECQHVAIKCLNKRVVDNQVIHGRTTEDPYTEIVRMHTIGDNLHVLRCIEALEDDSYIYIIMPRCEGSLASFIPDANRLLDGQDDPIRERMPEAEARDLFKQILENLQYLRDNRICHRGLSSTNYMIYQGRVVFINFALSFQLPPNAVHVHGTDVSGIPAHQPYLPPEVFMGLPYDAYMCDLWAAVVTLFNLLTAKNLYRVPYSDDLKFRFFILCGGISMTPRHDLMHEIWNGLNEFQRLEFSSIIARFSELSPEVKEIFDGVLRMTERWDLDAVAASAFITQLGLVQGIIL